MGRVKVGVVGCGVISSTYIKNLKNFDVLDVVACADLVLERAQMRATEFGIPKACSVDELLADPEIDIVVNLTVPKAHAEVTLAALESGKHVYVEKPLAIHLNDGRRILDLAKSKGLLVGCAPETFMGGGLQTCRKLIDDGWIGKPIGATAFLLKSGPESWHPDPEFFYQTGGGPLFDMGPYYLTALVHLLGPIRHVSGSARITFPERLITSEPKFGQRITVEVPTHVVAILEFDNGAIGNLITSFDVIHSEITRKIEIYGTEGTLSVPDPNTFGGPVRIRRQGAERWDEIPLTHGYSDNSRGIGVADMAHALRTGRAHRVHGEMAFHILEVMHGIYTSSASGHKYEVTSTCQRPSPLPMGLLPWTLD
ncbi:Gfo/Idh/MocA family protein [Alicyclobacillus macrosporangiidus]|uniref:Predicted dehydrogenase n=1 Tax=Alicyclobacillus macrosporangiidus TaxID=392015 RepID=A0A1I7L4Z1_9BACL|nr:Gfo/Idh/MocA family oxidoreductase [Alicyclobacillus macrosporangiidus]SFV04715.1 Predicted dehydrogenase [Alicyclobacillus macrosporangiidus]